MPDRLVAICRFLIPPGEGIHWPSFYIPHYRDQALLPDGRPRVKFLSENMGLKVTAAERDAAWARAKELGHADLAGPDYDILLGYYFDDRAT